MPHDHLINHPDALAAFSIVIVVMLLLDLGVFNKHSHVVSNKETLKPNLATVANSPFGG